MRVLILCTGNSCRSQMAEGYLKHKHKDWQIYSAGTFPEKQVNPNAVKVMKEIGIDISKNKPKHVNLFVQENFDYVITVCDHAKETCPTFSGNVKHRIHKNFPDPALATGPEDYVLNVYRKVRDDIINWLDEIFN